MKIMIIAAAFAGMLGFTAHGQVAVPSHGIGHGATDHCWVTPVALTDLPVDRTGIEPVYLSAIC